MDRDTTTSLKRKISVIIAAHKEYRMPEDSLYLPLHVGAEGKTDENGNPLDLGYLKDNTGDNISAKNPMYCELTGLYWAWKNLDSDYIGLAHYRRHFCGKGSGKDQFDKVLRGKEVRFLIKKGYKVIVPRKRRYYIESLYSHYVHTYQAEELDKTREIIEEYCPEYLDSYFTQTAFLSPQQQQTARPASRSQAQSIRQQQLHVWRHSARPGRMRQDVQGHRYSRTRNPDL